VHDDQGPELGPGGDVEGTDADGEERDGFDVPEWVSEFRRLYVEPKTRDAVKKDAYRYGRRALPPVHVSRAASTPPVDTSVPEPETSDTREPAEQPMADEPLRSRSELHRDRRSAPRGRSASRGPETERHEPAGTAPPTRSGSRSELRRARQQQARVERRMRLRRTIVVGVLLLVVAAVVTWLVARNREPVSASPAALVLPVVAVTAPPPSSGPGGGAEVDGSAVLPLTATAPDGARAESGVQQQEVVRRIPTPRASPSSETTVRAAAAPEPTPTPTPTPAARGTGSMSWVDWGEVEGTRTSGGRVVRVALEIEGGLDLDRASTATEIAGILVDDRGWQTAKDVRFVFVTPDEAARGEFDTRIGIASRLTTMDLCGTVQTRGFTSCYNGRVVINLDRWTLGVDAYAEHLDEYRVYVVDHEMGHYLGLGHDGCTGKGDLASVMVPQTLHLWGCQPNPYPVLD
jgi:hypothetical protein